MAAVDKIDVARIVMECLDGLSAKAKVSTIQAANQILKRWLDTPAVPNGQVCNVQIVFEDGLQYRSQVRLDRSRQRFCLARHLRKELTASTSGKQRKNRHEAGNDASSLDRPGAVDAGNPSFPSLDRYDI